MDIVRISQQRINASTNYEEQYIGTDNDFGSTNDAVGFGND